jgi:hypothetical protein
MLARTVARLQHAVLQHARVVPTVCEHGFLQGSVARFFGSGYLDRNQVTERIISSVKNFEKVDPNKVRSALFLTVMLDCSPVSRMLWNQSIRHANTTFHVNTKAFRDAAGDCRDDP